MTDPLPRRWCAGCDKTRLWSLMAWTPEGTYRCSYCRALAVYVQTDNGPEIKLLFKDERQ